LDVPALANGAGPARPFPAVFIRAPRLVAANGKAEVLATLADGTAVAAQEGHWLVTSFHPELTDDDRFHRYFLDLVAG
jgi:pyridoxal 5'-phosphate synthase pdxT subunit